MNLISGSLTIDPWLQRHFSTFAITILQDNSVNLILSSMVNWHIQELTFNKQISGVTSKIIDAIFSSLKK
jgi:hypothetical protein